MRRVSVDHYENFPVASLLCPPALRPPIAAIYWFARTADDLADEGDASEPQRLADLRDYKAALHAAAAGSIPGERWRPVFEPLGDAIRRHALPVHLLDALLSAFEQDVVKQRYVDRGELLDYCDRSANPVGRLLLHLYGVDNREALRQSDAICSALQLINFWQDLSVDTVRGRLYIPVSDCTRHELPIPSVMARQDSPALRRAVADMVTWSRSMMVTGAPLVHRLPGRSGWELRLVVQGGLRILDKIAKLDFAVISRRPSLKPIDAAPMLWRAIAMRPPKHAARSETA
jgi:squalene synthase HpnC